jgi:hypothetical protein
MKFSLHGSACFCLMVAPAERMAKVGPPGEDCRNGRQGSLTRGNRLKIGGNPEIEAGRRADGRTDGVPGNVA